MYNGCLKQGHFCKQWKVQRLVLISKGKGDLNTVSAYRPLCMLGTAEKVLEKIIRPRLQSAIQAAGSLSDRQYGSRPGLSTIDPIRTVVNITEQAQQGNHYSRKICVAAKLDVRNAFNSLRWEDALSTLRDRFRVPGYLLRVMQSYLRDRVLLYDATEGRRTKVVTAAAAQGSVLGPDIWNIDYNEILGLSRLPEGASLIGYADDIVLVITIKNLEEAQRKLDVTMRRILNWRRELSLQLDTHKSEVVLLT